MHHIIKHAIGRLKTWSLNCIPQSTEKFLSLLVYIKDSVGLRFIDSLQFLNTSLAKLAQNLTDTPHLDSITTMPDYIKSSASKSVFPYSYIDSFTRLEEQRSSLPPISDFFDFLTQQVNITQDDHNTAARVYKDCNCNCLKDYMLLYMKLDIYLLADIFESFRAAALSEDSLDPLNFYSIPGLSWASALKSMNQPLQLLSDHTMYNFFESAIRGGMTFINKHRVTSRDDGELLYIDVNNLYGWSLSQKLPCSDFGWILNDDVLERLIYELPRMDVNSNFGFIFEVDLITPSELHDKLDQLPPAPIFEMPPDSKVNKLLLHHKDKCNYVIHFRLLQCYILLGVKVSKVHRAIKFQQDHVFMSYIDSNTTKRALATNDFTKSYYKLKNNSLYGKTVENIRKRTNLRLCNTVKKLVTYSSKALFKRSIKITEDLVIATMFKEAICLNRPVYIGQAVLDLSKLRMYTLNYTELAKYRQEFNCSIDIIAADTDSFFLCCRGVNLNSQLLPAMIKDELLDTSNYPSTHPLYSKKFAAQIGKFKDESGGVDKYSDWIFLRPKLYSLLTVNDNEFNKAKGVIMKQARLTHKRYLEVLNDTEPHYVKQRRIGSTNHQLYSFESTRRALTSTDDKRLWIGSNQSVAYGHYRHHLA